MECRAATCTFGKFYNWLNSGVLNRCEAKPPLTSLRRGREKRGDGVGSTELVSYLIVFRARQRIRDGFFKRSGPFPLVSRPAPAVGADLIHG
jgi:hypothetical protein